MKKKNSRGFTLIELLAVIVILSSLSLVVISSITTSLAKRDEKECEEQQALALNAAKIYFSLNEDVTEVTVGKLKTDGYFSKDSSMERIKDETKIGINKSDGKIDFKTSNSCN